MSRVAGNWLSWIGIILAILVFFWKPLIMEIVA